jgi:AcrR family transcriptional regulator
MTAKLTPLKEIRRDKILSVAEHVFATQGYRATTMEAVADAAGMSRVTIYGYFKHKDDIFTAVAEALASRIDKAVSAALSAKGELVERVASALVAKHEIVFDVVRSSVFSIELFTAKDRVVAKLFAMLDAKIERQIAKHLRSCFCNASEAKTMAHLLFGASQGISTFAKSKAEGNAGIRTLVGKMLD